MTDHREGLSRERSHVAVDGDVHHRLTGDEQHQPGHRRLGEMVVAVPDDDRASGQKADVEDDDKQPSEQPVFFHDETVHVVLEHDRHDVPLGAAPRSLADHSALMDGDLRAHRLLDVVKRVLELLAVLRTFTYYLQIVLYPGSCDAADGRIQMREQFLAVTVRVNDRDYSKEHYQRPGWSDKFLDAYSSDQDRDEHHAPDEHRAGQTSHGTNSERKGRCLHHHRRSLWDRHRYVAGEPRG